MSHLAEELLRRRTRTQAARARPEHLGRSFVAEADEPVIPATTAAWSSAGTFTHWVPKRLSQHLVLLQYGFRRVASRVCKDSEPMQFQRV